MSDVINVDILWRGAGEMFEVYHQARLAGALEDPIHHVEQSNLLTYMRLRFDDPQKAMLFKLAHGGAA